MDQFITAPTELRFSNLSVDTRFADQYYHGTTDFLIRLPSTMRNVMRIAFASIELPLVAPVFSAAKGNTCFIVGSYVVTIPDSSYILGGLQMAPEIQKAMDATGLMDVSCNYDLPTNRFSFVNGGASAVTISLVSPDIGSCAVPCVSSVATAARFWGIGYNLGFRTKTIVVPAGETVTATEAPQIQAPAYYLVQVRCPDMMEDTLHRTEAGSSVQALAKVILRNGAYVLNTDDGANNLRKETTFVSPTSISQLRVTLVDAYGRLVEMGDVDWSMTFEFVEVMNACQANKVIRAVGHC